MCWVIGRGRIRKMKRNRSRRRPPSSLGEILGEQTRRWRIQHLQRLEVIKRKWQEAAGPYLASQVVPARLVRKTLRLIAADATWLQQMTYLKEMLLERLGQLLPGPWVEEIKVVTGEPLPPVEPSRKPAPPRLAEATEEMREKVTAACVQIGSPQVAEAVGRAMLSWLRLDAARPDGIDKNKKEE